MEKVEILDFAKNPGYNNPILTTNYGADPYAMVYDGRVYIYMTGDEMMYDKDGAIVENNYSNINTIRVVSSDDLVNWTNHGEVYAAGANGAAKWGGNSWAPAACWKMVDGKPKFFLYFANSGNGIAVLTSDSPTGPFTDPIGKALISRATPTCAAVAWLFDPAVLVDDDGCGYIYFGGGIPGPGKEANPGTARVCKLGDDFISLDGDPIPIENVPYLFEDSGINKINGKYVYSYCSNFNVPAGGAEGYGFGNGEIITMVSDNPMGPFKTVGSVLKNPGYFFGDGGNNHHCMFEFNGKFYITYHARLLEKGLGKTGGYRSTNVDEAVIGADGNVKPIQGTKEGVSQVRKFNPYREISASTMANQSGIEIVPATSDAAKYGSGDFNIKVSNGSWVQLTGVDFGDDASKYLKMTIKGAKAGAVTVRLDYLKGADYERFEFEGKEDFSEFSFKFAKPISGEHNLFIIFEGDGYEISSYIFE